MKLTNEELKTLKPCPTHWARTVLKDGGRCVLKADTALHNAPYCDDCLEILKQAIGDKTCGTTLK